MPASITGKTQPWFTINSLLSDTVTTATPIDVTKITAVAFDVDVNITIDALATPFALSAGTPMGIDSNTETVTVDVDAFMFAMGGK